MSSIDQSGRRLPPYSDEAERGVLGSALIESNRVIELCSMKALSTESFYVPAHRLLFEHLMGMYQGARAIDLLTVGEDLKKSGRLDQAGGYAFLEALIDSTPTSAHAEYYIDIVQQKHLLRRIISQAAEAIDHCYTDEDAEELLSRTEEAFFELSDKKNASSEDWKKVVYNTAGQIRNGDIQDNGVPTGFIDLDKKLRGLHNTDMIVLAARPSMGKTSLAMNIAEHAALGRGGGKKHSVGVFSLEMSQEQLVRRMLFSKAGVPAWKDSFFSADEHSKISSAADQLMKASIIVDDSAGLDVMDLRARARRMKRIHNVDLIVIDYLQLLADKRRSREGRQQETASISNSIKAMAKELKIPVLILSQLSRAPEQGTRDGKPRLSDLRDSGAIEQDADVVLLLQRPFYYSKDKEADAASGEDTLAIVDIAKHRNGPIGEVKMNFFSDITRFEDRVERHGVDGAAE